MEFGKRPLRGIGAAFFVDKEHPATEFVNDAGGEHE